MIPLYKPYMPSLPKLNEILYSGKLTCGKWTKKFEEEIANFLGINKDKVLVTNSFNMSIAVTLSLLNINEGDEVIVSPMACLASTQPLASHNIKLVWADVNPERGTLDPESVKSKITKNTKAIIHNHFCGFPGFIDEINDISKERNIPVIDDCLEAFGSEYKNKKIGNVGSDITIYSFNPVRIPNTIDGGCIVINNNSLIDKAILIRDCGIDRTKFRDELGEINQTCDITLKGFSATMSNVNAYIGVEQMKYLNDIIIKQRNISKKWDSYLINEKINNLNKNDINPNYWVYGVLANDKEEFIKRYRLLGYYASSVHINNNIYSIFGKEETLKGVREFNNHFVALPCGWWMSDNDII
ncbi:MAG: aminotransferase class V-fold PLP-dependent enzyme [Eubacteriales bacterium]|nr:aminotransferase class V-fold PLP-dependent enzyme [Eubacteriales bacterium]